MVALADRGRGGEPRGGCTHAGLRRGPAGRRRWRWRSPPPQGDYVMAAIVGAAGLPDAGRGAAGKRLLLANKESLVMAGTLLLEAVVVTAPR